MSSLYNPPSHGVLFFKKKKIKESKYSLIVSFVGKKHLHHLYQGFHIPNSLSPLNHLLSLLVLHKNPNFF